MATSLLKVTVDAPEAPGHTSNKVVRDASHRRQALHRLGDYFHSLAAGINKAAVYVSLDSATNTTKASATNTITQSSLVATTDTLSIGSVTLTWVNAAANEDQITIGGDDAACATNCAAVVNAHSKLKGIVSATAAAGVVTITAATPGRWGNLITLAEAGSGQVLSGAALSGATSTEQAAIRTYQVGRA